MASQTKVKCSLMMDDKTRRAWIRVEVNSLSKPTVWGQVDVDADGPKLEYRVQSAGELLATYQAEHYGDRHNVREIGRTAVACLTEIQERARKAKQGQQLGQAL